MENKVKFVNGKNYQIPLKADVKLMLSDKKIMVKKTLKKEINLQRFKKLTKYTYMDKETGEKKVYQIRYYKSEKSIKDNMRKLRTLIELYFCKYDNIHFLTLTCQEKIIDIEKVKEYTQKFIRKLKDRFKQYELMYIYKFERQINKNWHVHIILKDINNRKIFIQYEDIKRLWNKGIVYIEVVQKNLSNIKDIKNNCTEENMNNSLGKITSYMCKTSQLYDIPNGSRIYGHSSNIKKPKTIKLKKYEAQEIIKKDGAKFESERTVIIQDVETNQIVNQHKTEIYIRKKDKNKGEKSVNF